MGRKTRRESLTRPSVLRTLGREPGSPRLTRYARYAFGAPPGGTEGEKDERVTVRQERSVRRRTSDPRDTNNPAFSSFIHLLFVSRALRSPRGSLTRCLRPPFT